jgi:hypothetical protein
VQADEVTSVERYDGATGSNRAVQHNGVRHGLVCLAQFRERDDLMSKTAQRFDRRVREVFVSEQLCHGGSRGFVFSDLSLDFFAMRPHIGPRVREVFSMKRGIRVEERCLAGTESPCLLQNPHWNPGAHDRGLATADAGSRVDARKGVAELLDDSLQQAGLFPRGHPGQKCIRIDRHVSR